ncbi:MAG: hypothetical protein SGJ04_05520 [Bacteroidota bacterium]|nr:hypothetical protein [Bacteroidota bacterium]
MRLLKRVAIGILILGLIGFAAWTLLYKNSNQGAVVPLQAFSIADTGSITKIIISNKLGDTSTLIRQTNGGWMVNNTYQVDKVKIYNLLATLKLIQIKNTLSDSAKQNTIKTMMMGSFSFEAYNGDKLLNKYYVGMPTQDQLGTNMYLPDYDAIIVTHEPGFNGYLSPRYIAEAEQWRSKSVYELKAEQIVKVKINYKNTPNADFELIKTQKGGYTLTQLARNQTISITDDQAMFYLSGYKKIFFEGFTHFNKLERDSVLKQTEFARIQVQTTTKQLPDLVLFEMKPDNRTKQVRESSGMDADHFFATQIPKGTDLFQMQTLVLQQILAGYDAIAKGK